MSGPQAKCLGDDMNKPPQTFEEYAGYSSREMRQRAIEAGCRTIFDMLDWLDKHYGDRPEREQNSGRAPGRFRRPIE